LWSTWAEIHPETAARLGIERGDIVEVKTPQGAIRVPALPYLGVRPDTVAVPLGQGHSSPSQANWFDGRDKAVQWGYGRYARAIGVNALDLLPVRSNTGGGFVGVSRCSISKTGDHVNVVTTEGSARQHGRGIAQAISVNEIGRGHGDTGGGAAGEHEKLPGDASHEFLPGLRSPVAADAQGE